MMRVAVCLALGWWLSVATPIRAQEPSPERDHTKQSDLEPAVDTSAAQDSADAATPGQTPAPPAREAKGRVRGRVMDRLELEATQITGNRELPKVLYIVPWKRSDLGDLVGKPAGSLLDEVLAPVDRDVFRRENRYYRALQPDDPDAAGTRPVVEPPAGDES